MSQQHLEVFQGHNNISECYVWILIMYILFYLLQKDEDPNIYGVFCFLSLVG